MRRLRFIALIPLSICAGAAAYAIYWFLFRLFLAAFVGDPAQWWPTRLILVGVSHYLAGIAAVAAPALASGDRAARVADCAGIIVTALAVVSFALAAYMRIWESCLGAVLLAAGALYYSLLDRRPR